MKRMGSIQRVAFTLATLSFGALAGCGSVSGGGDGGSGGSGGSGGAGGAGGNGSCIVTGCSGQICADEDVGSTCEWTDAYACYPQFGVCERDAAGQCGWRQTDELQACIDAADRTLAMGACIRNADDACTSDADCMNGGCGGELCFNPAVSDGVSDCDCTAPQGPNCGCVNGTCAWWE